jgi:hypothetical protein
MTDPRLLEILEACVQDVRAGRRTVSECLAAYPEEREALADLLPAVLAVAPPPVTIDPQRKLVARQRFIEALYQESQASWWNQLLGALGPGYRMLRVGLATATLLLVLTTGVFSVAVASQDARPGDLLYPVRTALEDVQVAAAGAPEARARVRLALVTQHLSDVERAIETQDDENARRAAAAYEEALARARAELERARVVPEAVPELDQTIENTLRRQQRVAERARERGAASTGATLERARDQLVVRPAEVTPPAPSPVQPAPTGTSPEPTGTLPTAPTASVSPQPTNESALVEVPATLLATPTPVPAGTTATPGSVRGVIVPPQEIARLPGNGSTPVVAALAPPTPPTAVPLPSPTMIGVPGIPVPDPRGPAILPPVPPRNGPGNGQQPGAATQSPRDPPPAIAAAPRSVLTPVPLPSAPGDQSPAAEVRATPARPEDPRLAPDRFDPDPPRVPVDPRTIPGAGPPLAMPQPPPNPGFVPVPPLQQPPVQQPFGQQPFQQPSIPQPPAQAGGPAAQPAQPDAPAAAVAPPAFAPQPSAAGAAAPAALQQPTPRPTATRTPTPTTILIPIPVPPTAVTQPGSRVNNGLPGIESSAPSSAGMSVVPPQLSSGGGQSVSLGNPSGDASSAGDGSTGSGGHQLATP